MSPIFFPDTKIILRHDVQELKPLPKVLGMHSECHGLVYLERRPETRALVCDRCSWQFLLPSEVLNLAQLRHFLRLCFNRYTPVARIFPSI